MGEIYEIVRLGDTYYIEYQDHNTGWEVKVITITTKQVLLIEALTEKQTDDMNILLKSMTLEAE